MTAFDSSAKFSVSSLLLLAVLSVPAGAATQKWVDQAGGSDANDGNSAETAYATLQFCIDQSVSGTIGDPSIINVMDGSYETTGQMNGRGYSTAILIDGFDFLTIRAVPGHDPEIKPSTPVVVSISVQNSSNLIVDHIDSDQTIAQFDSWHVAEIDNLTIRNSAFEGGKCGIDFNAGITTALIENNVFQDITAGSGDEALDFSDGTYSDVIIQDNTFLNNYRHIKIFPPSGQSASDFIIRRNYMDGTSSQEGVRLTGADNVLLENNCILNGLQQGLYIDNGCSDISVIHNTFFNHGFEEIRTKVTTADILIVNNIINANGTHAAIGAAVSPLPGEDYNLIFNEGPATESGSQSQVADFGPNTDVNVDPEFENTTPGSEDLHLLPGSPAIESGTDLGVGDDNEQNFRPNPPFSNPDKGCLEAGDTGGSDVPTVDRWGSFALLGLFALLFSWAALRRGQMMDSDFHRRT